MYATQISIEQPIEYCPAGENNTGFVWVAPAPQLVVGELKELADANGVEAVRTGGYWIGPRLGAVPAGKQACAGEKVVYHVHGEPRTAFWLWRADKACMTTGGAYVVSRMFVL